MFIIYFVISIWVVFFVNAFCLNHKVKYFLPYKKEEVLLAPFYVFFLILSIKIALFLLNDKSAFDHLDTLGYLSMITGLILGGFSVFLFTYVNFFEKNFPSCYALEKGSRLEGVYNYIRHPSYIVYSTILFGSALCLLNKTLFIIAIVNHFSLYFYYIIDEKKFIKRFPHYKDYLKKTRRFLPVFPEHSNKK